MCRSSRCHRYPIWLKVSDFCTEIVIGVWEALMSFPFFLHPLTWAWAFCFKTIFSSNIHHVPPFTLLLPVIFFSSNSFFHQIISRFYSTSVGLVVLLYVSNLIKLRMLHRPCIYLPASFHCHSLLFQICLPLWVVLSIFQFGTALPAAPCLVYSARAPVMRLLLIKPHFPPLKCSPKHKHSQAREGKRVQMRKNNEIK